MEENSISRGKILILSTAYLPSIGGSELAIKNITDRIKDFEFHLVTAKPDKRLPRCERIGNVDVFRVGGCLSLSRILLPKNLLPLAVFFKARRLMKKNRYKLVHAFQLSGAAGAGWLIKIFYPGVPFVVTVQEGQNLQTQGFLVNFFRKLIVKKADRATAISQYLKNYLFGIKKDLPVTVIPNGVDFEHFSKEFSYGELASLEKDLGVHPDDKVIITVSRLVPKNGLDLLIGAAAIMRPDRKLIAENCKLIIIGNGPEKEKLKKLANDLGVEDNIVFLGSINNDDLPKYLKISDVFVRPSRSEGLGTAFLEAMAAGVPIIAPRIGGIPDFLEDRKTGLFCSLEPEDIAFKIRIILENDSLRREVVANARRLIEEKYDLDRVAGEYKEIYNLPTFRV